MKALIVAITFLFAMNSYALEFDIENMSLAQEQQLFASLKQVDPKIVQTILSEDAYQWYLDNMENALGGSEEENSKSLTSGPEIDYSSFEAPQFN
ncbi:MAG: hypothetical protein KDD33_08465 [Bdellovibrionales bacterium]|nr:hypothetical protein [Bdellovibrionales bacterium]